MAHQPKAYKKFVATAATATLVASAIAPAASAATPNFTDVSKSYKDAVNYLVENGIAKGTTETTFGTSNNITRGDAAVMIANALKLDTAKAPDAGFKDVNARVAGAVNAIVEAKIASGKSDTKFDPDAKITRQEMAKMLANAYKLTAKENANFKDVNNNWIGYVSALKEAGITLGKTETTFAPTENLTRGEFALFVFRAEGGVEKPVNPSVEVKNVEAINGGQLLVTFGTDVDWTTATDVSNYSLSDGKTVVDAEYLDPTSVLLTLDTAYPNTKAHAVAITIQNVTVDGTVDTKIPVFTKVIMIHDTTKPEVDSVTSVTNANSTNTVNVAFTEPIQAGATFKINGVSASAALVSGDQYVTVTSQTALEVGKAHKIEVVNVKDMSGNVTSVSSKEFTITQDKVAPVVKSVEAHGDNKLLVTFDKKMKNDATALSNLVNNIKVKNDVYGDVTVTGVTPLSSNPTKQFVVQLDKNQAKNLFTSTKTAHTLTVLFVDKTIEDYLGNRLAGMTTTTTLTKDTVAPEITGTSFKKNSAGEVTAVTVSFSEGVAASTLTFPSTMVNENGVVVDTSSVLPNLKTATVAEGAKSATFDLTSAKAVTGKYSVAFPTAWVKDTSLAENSSKAYTAIIDFGTTQASGEFTIADADVTASNNVITVKFPEAVKGGAVAGSATDASHYSINGQALPVGTSITLNAAGNPAGSAAQTIATITLPSQTILKSDDAAIFTVNGVQSLTGKTNKSFTKAITVVDNTSPVLQSAKVLDNQTIELTYNEAIALNGTDVGADFIIENGSTIALAASELKASAVSGFPTKIKIAINKPGTAGAATKGGAQAAKIALANETSANKTEVGNFTVALNGSTLEVKNGATVVKALDASGNGNFTFNGVSVTVTGAADGDAFTVSTTAAVAATVLDLSRDINVETKSSTVVKDTASNVQKTGVKVTVTK